MPITKRSTGWMVEVNRSKALDGYKRIRTQFNGLYEEARLFEKSIGDTIDKYGKWPITENDEPLPVEGERRSGTLRKATEGALENHWKGTPNHKTVEKTIWHIVEFFEDRGKLDIDDLTSEDIDAYVKSRRDKGNSSTTINARISSISVVIDWAMERKPPLATVKVPLKRLKKTHKEKWWLTPELFEEAVKWLQSQGDVVFADYISTMVYQGVRVEESLRLEPRHFADMDTDKPWMKVPGTKTEGSESSIPVYPNAVEVIKRSIVRAQSNGWEFLFPYTWRQASDRWNEVRDFIGAADIDSATLRALRRTFAYYANTKGMPTRTLQKVLRHNHITTTEGYLDLVGTNEAEQSREYFDKEDQPHGDNKSSLAQALEAMQQIGATPEELARFAKELMK